MLDDTKVKEVEVGDEAVLFGTQGNNCIMIDELAGALGTINNEVA